MSTVLYDIPGPKARRRSLIGSILGGLAVAGLIVAALFQLAKRDQLDIERWRVLWDPPKGATAANVWTSLLVEGLGATLRAAAVAAVLALALGLVLAVLRMANPILIRLPALAVIELFRGIPVVLLMFFGVIALGLPIFQGVVFGLVVYNMAVFGEILRAGIVSLPKGQREAAEAIGLSQPQTLFLILLPQAVRRMMPTLISQVVVLLKDTSLGFIVAYAECCAPSRRTRSSSAAASCCSCSPRARSSTSW
jgi:glutamate transport system permease protein